MDPSLDCQLMKLQECDEQGLPIRVPELGLDEVAIRHALPMAETERSVKDGTTKGAPDIDDLSAGPEQAISVS